MGLRISRNSNSDTWPPRGSRLPTNENCREFGFEDGIWGLQKLLFKVVNGEKSCECGKGATFVKPGVVPSTKNKVFPRSYFNLVKNSKVLVNSVIMIETKLKHFMFLLILKSMYTKTFKKKSKEKGVFVTYYNACI